jgi:agmatinase
VRQVRDMGVQGVLDIIPEAPSYYFTIDIDGFDPSIAPGTGTPSHGGFLYYEVLEIIEALVKRCQGRIVGMDLVEVAPAYDPTGVTAILAAQLLLNSLGFIFHQRQLAKRA